jgi:hypothetical protein
MIRNSAMALLVLLALVSLARADDVTLKSGKVYKDLSLINETKTSYVFVDADGRKVSLS